MTRLALPIGELPISTGYRALFLVHGMCYAVSGVRNSGLFFGTVDPAAGAREVLLADGGWEDRSYPSQIQQLLWRLEDYKDILLRLIEERRRWETAYYGAPRSDYETQYREWPNQWPPRNPEAFYAIPNTLSPGEEFPLDDIMDAIASTQNRLLFYGYDAEAEEARQIRSADSAPPEGQLPLPLAA